MNLSNNTLVLVMVPAVLALSAAAFVGPLSDIALAQIITGTPGEAGTQNNSEADYTPLSPNQTAPETLQSLEQELGSNEAILQNDTNISNPNITAADAGTVNKQEECMNEPNQSAVACP